VRREGGTDGAGSRIHATPKILFPLLEGASFEEDENLHDMWAALLANAAWSENREVVRPGFIATLKQLSVDDAKLISRIYDMALRFKELDIALGFDQILRVYSELGFPADVRWDSSPVKCPSTSSERELYSCLYGLEASGLVLSRSDMFLGGVGSYSLTARGYQFVTVCRLPKPKP
jgi:hypothetical protein